MAQGSQLSENVAQPQQQVAAIWILDRLEPDSIDALHEYLEALAQLPFDAELTVVVNGTVIDRDKLVHQFEKHHVSTQIVQIHRHCDESTAIKAGLECARGDIVALLPTYVQVDPSALADMVAEVQGGAHFVASWRDPRVDSGWNQFKSRMFNRITQSLTGVKLHDINSGLRVMSRKITAHLPIYGDLHRFLPILAEMQGYIVTEVRVEHVSERVRKGDFRIGVYLRRVLDLITLFFLFKFTKKPLRFFGLLGSGSMGIGLVVMLIVTTERFLGVAMADRPALLIAVLLIVLGVQLFSIGLLGELIIFTHGRHLMHQYVEEVTAPHRRDGGSQSPAEDLSDKHESEV